jgi:hypothetical protein
MALSIEQLDISNPCNTGFEFEYIPESTGVPSGVFITVIGAHAEAVKTWTLKRLNQFRQREAMLEKKGQSTVRTAEEDVRFSIENAAMRVKSWRGITEECTFENVCKLCEINPLIRDQIIKESENLGNFMTSK